MYLFLIFIYAFAVATRKRLDDLVYFLGLFLVIVVALRPKRRVIKFLGVLFSFESLIFLTALFWPGTPILNTPLGLITREGVYRFFLLLGKAYLSSSTVVVIVSSIGFPTIIAEMEKLRIPRILTLTLMFTYRYIDLLIEEAERMKKALDSRCISVGRLEYYKMLGSLIGELLVRAYYRSVRIYWAMLSRNFETFPDLSCGSSKVVVPLTVLALGGFLV
ncbi:cobalt ABC transporter permease [Thermococcus chitonophagus]|uniref:Cobalt ABC transporter permease n=1 Tax=Thermococcus chitonophagus TaxID=54262 RepID=A0A160VSE8_9EURY|nr:CbiQ family ECF transporter T component [Thermococcus chitonophagus]ASJ17377.1 cobalt ABC transporter permease [Thermococcus chitonophagus]CUX78013.1 Transmembrane component NikQ of energizing module of nickel ECF transporter [Thermococcus chitonophagus]